MPQIQESIGRLLRPHFCVVLDLDPSNPLVDHPFDVSDLRGEFVGLAGTFEQARRLVPQPEYPADTVRQEHFHKRFGWNQIAMSDGSMVKQVPNFGFDDDPIGGGRQSDRELFAATYTIFWLCPADPAVIVRTLIEHAQTLCESDSRPYSLQSLLEQHFAVGPYSRPCETIDSYLLLYLWQNYFDRLCLWFDCAKATERIRYGFLESTRSGFVRQVSRLPHGPSTVDWDRLDELLLK